jgi:hypothetical protein
MVHVFLQPGFNGDACEKKDVCAEKCNQRGVCRWGNCFCDVGFSGEGCENQVDAKQCPAGCSGNGVCEAGVCFCKSSHTGIDCSTTVDLHTAANLFAKIQNAGKEKNSGVSGKSAFGVASLCFVIGIGAATLITKYR